MTTILVTGSTGAIGSKKPTKRPGAILGTALVLLAASLMGVIAEPASASQLPTDEKIPQGGTSPQFPSATGKDCHGVTAPVYVDDDNVRGKTGRYQPSPLRDPKTGLETGLVEVLVDVVSCKTIIAEGVSAPGICAAIGIAIEKPSGAPAPREKNFYLVNWYTNNRGAYNWLRHGTGLNDRVRNIGGLRYDGFGTFDAAISFAAPAPAPSPFWASGKAAGPTGPPIFGASYWRDTSEGRVRIDTPVGGTPGLASGLIETTSSSELGQLYSPQTTRDFTGYFTVNVIEDKWEKHVYG